MGKSDLKNDLLDEDKAINGIKLTYSDAYGYYDGEKLVTDVVPINP